MSCAPGKEKNHNKISNVLKYTYGANEACLFAKMFCENQTEKYLALIHQQVSIKPTRPCL